MQLNYGKQTSARKGMSGDAWDNITVWRVMRTLLSLPTRSHDVTAEAKPGEPERRCITTHMNSAPDEAFFMPVTPFIGVSEVLGHPRACPSPACERVVTSLPAQSYRQFSSNKESSKCMTRGPATTAATRPPSHCRSIARQHI